MKKEQANEVKNFIGRKYRSTYQSKTGELRVLVAATQDGFNESDEELKNRIKMNTCHILNTLSANGVRPKFRTDNKTYQGFIHKYYVIFE